MKLIRPAAVAHTFYPGDRRKLAESVDALLSEVRPAEKSAPPAAIIAPHAGYIYSGETAAAIYSRLKKSALKRPRITIIGPAHYVAFRGVALPEADAFTTPLGEIPLDSELVEKIRALPGVVVNGDAHRPEHCLEVQLPFLQKIFDDFTIVPLLTGKIEPEKLLPLMRELTAPPDSLLIISSDLSHFYDYDTACQLDKKTTTAIEELNPAEISEISSCGRTAIKALLLFAREKGWRASTIQLCNSGDTAGDHSRVVGYGAYAFARSA